jgi:hypothetical protein
MWSDNETSEDLLGFKVHANLLIDVVKDDIVLPISIGVFGDWGSGTHYFYSKNGTDKPEITTLQNMQSMTDKPNDYKLYNMEK